MLCRTCRADIEPTDAICANCGRALNALARGELLAGRFEILAVIGSGGMGIVYKAHDRSLEEDVALKVLRPEFASTREAARRFMSEIKLARRVSDRHVCRIHEFGEDGGLRYICMELIDGVNLKQLVQDHGALATEDAYEAGVQIADGLAAIHEAGVIHRDLKTPNIMRDARGIVRLMDFGIARGEGSLDLTVAGQVMGTPEYMSPEQALGYKLDLRTDIYSLGIVVYELFTGHVPFHGDNPGGHGAEADRGGASPRGPRARRGGARPRPGAGQGSGSSFQLGPRRGGRPAAGPRADAPTRCRPRLRHRCDHDCLLERASRVDRATGAGDRTRPLQPGQRHRPAAGARLSAGDPRLHGHGRRASRAAASGSAQLRQLAALARGAGPRGHRRRKPSRPHGPARRHLRRRRGRAAGRRLGA